MIDIQAAVAYNRKRPYSRDQWFAIHEFIGAGDNDTFEAYKVSEYQRAHGLTVDGKLGPHTERHMVEHGLVLRQHYDFAAWFDAKAQWSRDTFGPGDRYQGVVAHIRKELDEVSADPADLEEWVDVALLAMDGAWRSAGANGAAFLAAMLAKDAKNRARTWPDWRTLNPDQVSEHIEAPQGYEAASAVEWAMDRVLDWDAAPSYGGGNYQPDLVRTFWGNDKPFSNWCGAFVASCLEAGGVTVPPNTRRGAKRLTKWVAGHGRWVGNASDVRVSATFAAMRAGDVICWDRGVVSWAGHVALVLDVRNDGALDIAEGNVRDKTGKRGQLVRRILGPDEWPHRRKDGLRGLYGVARP